MYPEEHSNWQAIPYVPLVALQDAGVTKSPFESTFSGGHIIALSRDKNSRLIVYLILGTFLGYWDGL